MKYLKREGTCKIAECQSPVQARELCNKHYVAAWRAKKTTWLDQPTPVPHPLEGKQ